MIKREIHTFLTAVMFYTRVPVPGNLPWSEELLNRSTRYLPLIGLLAGGLSAGVCWLSSLLFPMSVSLLLAMIAPVLLTGAFHEDGLADFFDGFGLARSREETLRIMKDSRLGTFGVIGLVAVLALKYAALSALPTGMLYPALILAPAVSRFWPVVMIATTPYAREDGSSKIKPVAQRISAPTFLIAFLTTLLTLPLTSFLLPSALSLSFCLLPSALCLLFLLIFRKYVKDRIGGYTGDVLGALEQFSELIFYLTFLACIEWPA